MRKFQLLARFSLLLSLACLSFLVCGCGDGRPARVKVSGHVTVDGKPLKFGGISFKPVGGGRMAGGGFDQNGQYSTTMYKENDGLPVGKYTVAINAVESIGERAQRWHAPRRYSNHTTAELNVEISKETTDLNFELTWEESDHSKPWVENL